MCYNSNPNINNCLISGNKACGAPKIIILPGEGGGIYCNQSNPTITNSIIVNNRADYGGGIYCENSNPTIKNCLIIGNGDLVRRSDGRTLKEGGGGIYCNASSPTITNCTLAGNVNIYGKGGAIYSFNFSNPIIDNCILWDNIAKFGNQIALDVFTDIKISSSTATIAYSNVQGGQKEASMDPNCTLEWGLGNIDVDPLFVEQGYLDTNSTLDDPNDDFWVDGDYHLKSEYGRWDSVSESWVVDDITSPCIDGGDPNSPVGDEPEPNGGRVNMGAYGGTAEASKSGASWWFATTQGPIAAEGLGVILPHEHIFTDLRGPATRGYGQADAADVVRVMAPLLEDAKQKGVGVLFECSSIGVGRNVSIISEVSKVSGLPVVVPTGVYGRANFAPPEHRDMSEDELAELFISEIREGIEGTGIKAGFIKIATGGSNMTAMEEKFLLAAGRAANETGAAVASHTPIGSTAVRQADILESISPAIRFIWVHAQSVNNRSLYQQLAARGVFIEFDSLGWNPGQDSTFITAIKELLAAGYGEQILLSHDAGWYQPGEQDGGTQMPYTYLIQTFMPKLRDSGVDDEAIRMITETNPIRAFGFNQDVNP